MFVMFRRYNLVYAMAGGQNSSCKAGDRVKKKILLLELCSLQVKRLVYLLMLSCLQISGKETCCLQLFNISLRVVLLKPTHNMDHITACSSFDSKSKHFYITQSACTILCKSACLCPHILLNTMLHEAMIVLLYAPQSSNYTSIHDHMLKTLCGSI